MTPMATSRPAVILWERPPPTPTPIEARSVTAKLRPSPGGGQVRPKTEYAYDSAANLSVYTDEQHSRIGYYYNANDQLQRIHYYGDNGTTPEVSYTFNSRGLRQTMSD